MAESETNKLSLEHLVAGNDAFAIDLYQKLREQTGNFFFSPYCISVALAMAYASARGETAAQMARTLHFGLEPEQLHPAFKRLEADLKAIRAKGEVQLEIANALWPQLDYPMLESFLRLIEENYGVTLKTVDYRQECEAARQEINDWVAEKTQHRIMELLRTGVLTPLTRLVLTNAIYFKGNWASQFDPDLTQPAPFWFDANHSVETPLMYQEQEFWYGMADNVQILEMPYVGEDLAMLILLPTDINGLSTLEDELNLADLERWTQNLQLVKVEVYLPKFKFNSYFELDAALSDLGMSDAFNVEKADFSGMDGQRWLYIQAVVHQALVEVNEIGTEAAAATAVVSGLRSAPQQTPIFRADHPFIFLILDNNTGSSLFMGRVTDPSQ